MNTRLNVFANTSVALLLGLAWTSSAIAQEHTPELPVSGVDQIGCEQVEWHEEMLGDYPWISEACHEAIVVDGQTWVRFEAEFQEYNTGEDTFTAQFRNDSGRSLGIVDLEPAPGQRVSLDGNPTRFSNLRQGQILNFYAPEGTYGFATEPGASENEMASVTDSDREQETLPATAGPLPIIALGGFLSLLGGIGLTTRRRLKNPNA